MKHTMTRAGTSGATQTTNKANNVKTMTGAVCAIPETQHTATINTCG